MAPDAAAAAYPADAAARDRFVLDRRHARQPLDPWRHQGLVIDTEPDGCGGSLDVATVFLTGRECPWRCVMCDLWRHTTETDTPPGAIPAQVRAALDQLSARPGPRPPWLKLYNAGSFFDPRAVPVADDEAIAGMVSQLSKVIVEAHPQLVGTRAWRFRDRLPADTSLEVAMGLETAQPAALERLHKRVSLDRFARAASDLRAHGISLRVFLLVHPPFIPLHEQLTWLERSIAFAFDCGAAVVSLIPTRGGNGVLESLRELAEFHPPALSDLERAWEAGSAPGRGLVLADLWDLEAFSSCASCLPARRGRLLRQNVEQRAAPVVFCAECGAGVPS